MNSRRNTPKRVNPMKYVLTTLAVVGISSARAQAIALLSCGLTAGPNSAGRFVGNLPGDQVMIPGRSTFARSSANGFIGEFPTDQIAMGGPTHLTAEIGGVDYFFQRNHNRSVVVLTDAGGLVVEQVRYSNFGAPTLLDGNGQPIQGPGTGNPYAFRGMRYDPESGFYYCEETGRPYDPETGRFVCRGTAVGNPGNAYTVAGGNPWSGAERIDRGADKSTTCMTTAGGASGVIDLLNGGGSYAGVNPSSGTTYLIRVSSFHILLVSGVGTGPGWPVGLSGRNGGQSTSSLTTTGKPMTASHRLGQVSADDFNKVFRFDIHGPNLSVPDPPPQNYVKLGPSHYGPNGRRWRDRSPIGPAEPKYELGTVDPNGFRRHRLGRVSIDDFEAVFDFDNTNALLYRPEFEFPPWLTSDHMARMGRGRR